MISLKSVSTLLKSKIKTNNSRLCYLTLLVLSIYLLFVFLVFCLGGGRGANIDHKNNAGKTVVDYAREKGNEKAIKIMEENEEECNENDKKNEEIKRKIKNN